VGARLDPLAAAVADMGAARTAREVAERSAEALRGALAAAERDAATRLETARTREATERRRAEDLGRRKGVLDAEVREYRSAAAILAAAEAQERARIANEEGQRRAADVSAWGLVPRLVRRRELAAEIEELGQQMALQTQAQAPLRHLRNIAATRLRARLMSEIVIQREVIREARDEAGQRTTAADALDEQAREARDEAVLAKARREALE